jgi:hypothetical protein
MESKEGRKGTEHLGWRNIYADSILVNKSDRRPAGKPKCE